MVLVSLGKTNLYDSNNCSSICTPLDNSIFLASSSKLYYNFGKIFLHTYSFIGILSCENGKKRNSLSNRKSIFAKKFLKMSNCMIDQRSCYYSKRFYIVCSILFLNISSLTYQNRRNRPLESFYGSLVLKVVRNILYLSLRSLTTSLHIDHFIYLFSNKIFYRFCGSCNAMKWSK